MIGRILAAILEWLGRAGPLDDFEIATYYRIERGPRATARDEVDELMDELRRAG